MHRRAHHDSSTAGPVALHLYASCSASLPMCMQLGGDSAFRMDQICSLHVALGVGGAKGMQRLCATRARQRGCRGVGRVELPGLKGWPPQGAGRALHEGARLLHSAHCLHGFKLSSLALFPPFTPNTSVHQPTRPASSVFSYHLRALRPPILAPRKPLRLSATCSTYTTALSPQATSSESVMRTI